MNNETTFFLKFQTPLGEIGIGERNDAICGLWFANDPQPENIVPHGTPLLLEAGRQLHAYFAGSLQEFTLACAPEGTPFMQRVWSELCKIPYAETRSYRDIAVAAGVPKGARAVGMANGKNPIPIIIPCHRVIGASGKLVGYSSGIDIKVKLLELEKAVANGQTLLK